MASRTARSATSPRTSGSHISARRMATVCALLLLVAAAAPAQGVDKSFAAIENTQLFIPASAHVSGVGDANWRTDLEIFNPGQTRASVTVALLKAKTSNHNPQTRSYTLDPGEALRFEDALMSIFGFDGGAAIRVVNTSGMAAVTSRTYNLQPDGTFGQFVGGVISHTAIQPGQEGRIIQLTHNRSTTSGFRTNIGFVNATGSSITVQVALYRADGSYLGTKSYPLQPYMFQQEDKIFQKVVSGDVDDGYAVLTTSTAGGAFFAYGVVIDNRTDDPIYITPATRSAGSSPPPPTPTPTTTATTTPSPTPTTTPTATPTPTSTPTTTVNLAPYQPSGWSGPLVVSGTTGTRTSGGLTGGGATYFDWAVANYGPGDAVFPAGEAIARIALDGASRVNFFNNTVYTLEAGFYASYDDYQIDGISAGQHTATLLADPGHVIGESDESDNNSDYVGSWSSKSEPTDIRVKVPTARIRVAPIPGWQPETAKHRYDPIGVLWLGAPPLQPGPLAIAPTKATAVDNAMYIPASAHATGSGDTNWRTDVELHNPGSVQARARIDMLIRDQANPSPQIPHLHRQRRDLDPARGHSRLLIPLQRRGGPPDQYSPGRRDRHQPHLQSHVRRHLRPVRRHRPRVAGLRHR